MSSIRDAFVAKFGEDAAAKVETAAEEHANGENSNNRGSDPFKWSLLIAIGYECMELDGYRQYHGIDFAPWDEIKAWMVEHADLAAHDGDCDYLCAVTGGYNDFMPADEMGGGAR